jgi:LPXTG-site transpeptidase (sortase) family protein
MGIPTNFTDVGWYTGGPLPGMPGSAVIDGHLDGKNVREAVFYDLDKLAIGDLVEVADNQGQTLQFRVVATKIYDYDAITTDIFSGDTATSRLNLITCSGTWLKGEKLYDKRIVVFTELVAGN